MVIHSILPQYLCLFFLDIDVLFRIVNCIFRVKQMNSGGFSWKRFFGISALKSKISRRIGVPLTRSGRQRKIGALVERLFLSFFGIKSKSRTQTSRRR